MRDGFLLSRSERARLHRSALSDLARQMHTTEDEADDFVRTLPYSTIPEPFDGTVVVEWLLARGWTPPRKDTPS